MNKKIKNIGGYTFLEILISLSLIALLSAIVYVNIGTEGRFKDTRNEQRMSDINKIMQAIYLHKADNNSSLPLPISILDKNKNYQIGTGTQCDEPCYHPDLILEADCLDLGLMVSDGYMDTVPLDPDNSISSEEKTRYFLSVNDYNQITIGSCSEEADKNNNYPEIKIKK